MRDFLKSNPRWRQAGWLLPLVLLALPNCMVDVTGTMVTSLSVAPGSRNDALIRSGYGRPDWV